MPPKRPHLRSGPNDARDEAAQLVASGQEGGQVELEQVPVAVRGVQLLAELQHLLLQGVEAAQAALALLPPQPLLLRLPQALLLCLAQLQVEDLGKGPEGRQVTSLRGSWAFSSYMPPVLCGRQAFVDGPAAGKGRGQPYRPAIWARSSVPVCQDPTLGAGHSQTLKHPHRPAQTLTFALCRCSAFSFSCWPRASLELHEKRQEEAISRQPCPLRGSTPPKSLPL